MLAMELIEKRAWHAAAWLSISQLKVGHPLLLYKIRCTVFGRLTRYSVVCAIFQSIIFAIDCISSNASGH